MLQLLLLLKGAGKETLAISEDWTMIEDTFSGTSEYQVSSKTWLSQEAFTTTCHACDFDRITVLCMLRCLGDVFTTQGSILKASP